MSLASKRGFFSPVIFAVQIMGAPLNRRYKPIAPKPARRPKPQCTITTDASRCPKTKAAAWSAWLSHDDGPTRHGGVFHKDPPGIDTAEEWAIRNGLHMARKLGFRLVHVNSDSLNAIRVLQKMTPSDFGMQSIVYEHVKAHTGNPNSRSYVNRQVDKHAKTLMRAERKKRYVKQRTDIRRDNAGTGGASDKVE